MRIFLPHPFSNQLLYHLKKAQTIKAPYFEILHIFNTRPYKSIIGTYYNENNQHIHRPSPRFEAIYYLTHSHTQHLLDHNTLQTFNYIYADEPIMSHFILPIDIQPKDRLLLI